MARELDLLDAMLAKETVMYNDRPFRIKHIDSGMFSTLEELTEEQEDSSTVRVGPWDFSIYKDIKGELKWTVQSEQFRRDLLRKVFKKEIALDKM